MNGNNSSGNTPQFSKSRFAILEKLHKLRNWIKLLFLPVVVKRLPELSNEPKLLNNSISDFNDFRSMLNADIVILYDNGFIHYKDNEYNAKIPYAMFKDWCQNEYTEITISQR